MTAFFSGIQSQNWRRCDFSPYLGKAPKHIYRRAAAMQNRKIILIVNLKVIKANV